jgi:hypothetical protein
VPSAKCGNSGKSPEWKKNHKQKGNLSLRCYRPIVIEVTNVVGHGGQMQDMEFQETTVFVGQGA